MQAYDIDGAGCGASRQALKRTAAPAVARSPSQAAARVTRLLTHSSTPARSRRRATVLVVLALALVVAVCASFALAWAPHVSHALRVHAAGALAYSHASARVVQAQPAPRSCHARAAGLFELPDARCTPGALNPAVTPGDIASTICASGWTSRVRPPEAVSEREKFASLRAYAIAGYASEFEYDHLVPLELGGAVNDPRNMWPEPDYSSHSGYYANPKDHLERALNRLVCGGQMTLARAQQLIATNWASAYRTYG